MARFRWRSRSRAEDAAGAHFAPAVVAAGAVAVYTDDVEHDVVGSPTGPVHGRDAARGFYDQLIADINTEIMEPTRTLYGDDFCLIEHSATGTFPGAFMGIPGNGKRITFRMLHVFEFRDGRISRETVWLDGAAIAAQLTAATQNGAAVGVGDNRG